MKNYLLLAVAAVALAFTACKKDDPGADTPQVVAVTGVSLNKSAVALELGDSDILTAMVTPANATNKAVEWSIADASIATIMDGVVKAVAIGETTVTVTTVDGGFTASATITVAEGIIKVTGVTLDKPSLELEIGESVTVEATVTPENATNKAVEWSIADTAVATVSNGVVTGVAEGETELTVTTADGGHTATIPVKVVTEKVAVTGIEWINAPVKGYQIESGSVTQTFVLQISPNNATDVGVTFTSSDTNVMTINNVTYNENLIHVDFYAVGGGEATITATTNDGGFTATTETMTVIQAVLVESIEFSKESYAMNVGDVLALMPTVLPENADNKKLEWSTSDTSIISVDEQGMVEALAIGNATVTALATDGSGVSATVAIAVSNPATEVNFSGSDNYAKYTTWHGNKFELDVRTTPANADLRTLNWTFQTLNGQANPKGVSYEVTADKATVCCVVDENSTRNGCKVEVSTADNSDYAYAQVDFLTYAWIMASKNNGATFEYGAHALCESSNWKFNYEVVDYLSSQLYIVFYSPRDEQYLFLPVFQCFSSCTAALFP